MYLKHTNIPSIQPYVNYKKSLLSIKEDLSILHLRLGHVPFNKLKSIPSLSKLQKVSHNLISQICPQAKQTRASFSHNSIKTTAPFQLMHIDVWGPYKVKYSSGCNSAITIFDDFSRFTWIHLMKHRT